MLSMRILWPSRLPRTLGFTILLAVLPVARLTGAAPSQLGQPNSYPNLICSPASLDFGEVAIGQEKTILVTMTNAGRSNITISEAAAVGQSFGARRLEFPFTLGPGERYRFTSVFAPRSSGETSGSISFRWESSDGSGQVLSLGMTGAGEDAGQFVSGIGTHPHSVALAWNPSNSVDIAGYNVYRSNTDGGPYTRINTVLDPNTAYTDDSVMGGSTYYYVATAVDLSGQESNYSNEVQVVIPQGEE
jgi:hypothetical protein